MNITNKNIRLFYFLFFFLLCGRESLADEYDVSLLPEQIARAQTLIEADVTTINPGELVKHDNDWMSVWVFRRTEKDLEYIQQNRNGLDDVSIEAVITQIVKQANSTSGLLRARTLLQDQPTLEKSPYRSKQEEYFVFNPVGRLGCSVQLKPPPHMIPVQGAVFFDPCYGDQYDSAGRFIDQGAKLFSKETGEIIRSNPKIFPRLTIPPHHYKANGTLVIGVTDVDSLPKFSLQKDELYSGLTPTKKLLTATAFNDLNSVIEAIKDGADVNVSGNEPGSLALLRAVLYSSPDMVELLISKGAKSSAEILAWAERQDRPDVAKLLSRK